MKTEHPLQSDNGICFIQKWLSEVLIHLSHWETRQSIPVLYKEVSPWWIHNLTHPWTCSSEWNRRPRMSFFRSPKMWKSQGERSGCTEDVEVFPSQISEAYPSPDWQYGDGRYHVKVWFRPTAFHGVLTLWRVAAYSATKKRTTSLCSSLLVSFPMLDEHTSHYAHLKSNKETTVWTCAFSLHMSPSPQMAVSIRNNSVVSFREECVLWMVFGFHLTVPYINSRIGNM